MHASGYGVSRTRNTMLVGQYVKHRVLMSRLCKVDHKRLQREAFTTEAHGISVGSYSLKKLQPLVNSSG